MDHDPNRGFAARLRARRLRMAAQLVALLVLAVLVSACQRPWHDHSRLDNQTRILGRRVDVVVTMHSGAQLVVRHSVRWQRGMTALDALRQVADVRMAPGPGNLVAQVNGQGGGRLSTWGPERAGWYYRVNGLESTVDPGRFRVEPGASLWWDLRRFDIYPRIPLSVGVFPEPFLRGYRGHARRMRIAYGKDFRKDAELFRDRTFSRIAPEVEPFQDDGLLGRNQDRPLPTVAVRSNRANLVIGRWEEVRMDPYIADIAMDPRAYGLTVWIEGHDIRTQDPDAEFSTTLDEAEGLVWASTVDGEPDSAIVVVVTGITDEGVHAAARALRGGAFQYALAGAVDRDGNPLL